MALGLPIAVTIGWQLATPATRSVAFDDAPGGAGGLGDAPARHTRPASALSSVPSQLPSATPSVLPSAVSPTSGAPSVPATGAPTATSAPPTEAVSKAPLPPLTMPPVPTPTEPDWLSSVTPSGSIILTDPASFEPRFGWSGH